MCDSFIVGAASSQNPIPPPPIRGYLCEEYLDVLWASAVEDYVVPNAVDDVSGQEK